MKHGNCNNYDQIIVSDTIKHNFPGFK
uniref:Uncharacterized protein n=1 Tax=Lepeophtheirus salmonis TaxID=72036 RepID=A0A0K2SV45_LEPSM